MNEHHEAQLEILANNELMLQAIRIIFEESIEENKPEVGQGDNDDVLGQKYRAYEHAKKILAETFVTIASHRVTKNNNKGFNKAK